MGIGGYCYVTGGTVGVSCGIGDRFVDGHRCWRFRPRVSEEFGLATLETLSEPLLCSGVGEGEAVQERDTVLWECIRILGNGRKVTVSSVGAGMIWDEKRREDEREDGGGEMHGLGGTALRAGNDTSGPV